MEKPDKDLIVIGGGVAGLSAAQYGARAELKVLVLEEMSIGGQALIISELENYPGFPEPLDGFELAQKFETQARNFGAEIAYESVKSITKSGDIFTVTTGSNTYTSYAVIIASGAEHRKIGVKGENEFSGRGVSYCATCDGPFFKGKKILVVGGGDAACDEALYLSNLSDKITMIHRKDRFRAQKAIAQRVLDNNKIDVRFNSVLSEIKGGNKVSSVVIKDVESGKEYEEEMDAVFIFIGSNPKTAFAEAVEKDEASYIVTDEKMQTNIRGLYAAGDVRTTPFRQVVVSASDGAIAAHSVSAYIDELKGQAYS
ncbi:MAG: thioredoxin-disulfide reductase [Spirochaetales bacterium]|nr:thioredoxin-disulfide reductase [Spirochaetales bacterium]